MKTFKLKSGLVVLFLASTLLSCNNDDNDESVNRPSQKIAFATEVSGPEKGNVNTEINVEVTFTPDNACGIFNKFEETTIGTEKGLQILVDYPTEICITVVPEPVKKIYKFKSAVKGSFDLKFRKSDTEFIKKTVVVE